MTDHLEAGIPTDAAGFQALMPRYVSRTSRSRDWVIQTRPFLTDARSANRFEAAWKDYAYPIVCDRAAGSRLWDVDGNEYIDLLMGFGVHLLGHAPACVDRALRAQLEKGYAVGVENVAAGDAAEMIVSATRLDRAVFVNTGSEAVHVAIRIARAATGRQKVVMFADSYHGWYDGLAAMPDDDGNTVSIGPGIPAGAVADILLLDRSSPRSFQTLRNQGRDIAAIVVEPVGADLEGDQREFLAELRRVADEVGAALIFDEMVTGFRLAPGGAQEWFGVAPDVVTCGKVIGGGMPIGVVVGRRNFMDEVDGGAWTFGDESAPRPSRILFAGTFNRHPFAMSAARAVLAHITEEAPGLYSGLNARGDRLKSELDSLFSRRGAPFRVSGCASMVRVDSDDYPLRQLLSYHLLARGLYAWPGVWFLSTAHDDKDCDDIIAAVDDALEEIDAATP